jgi:hypothetical protein
MRIVKMTTLLFLSITMLLASLGMSVKGDTPTFGIIWIDTSNTDYNTSANAVEISDVDSQAPGNELIFTGWGWGTAEVYYNGTTWQSKFICNRSYEMWYDPALAVGDIDPDVEGNEIVEGLYELIVWAYDNTTGNWTNTTIWNPWSETYATVHDVKIGDFDPVHEGVELLVLTTGLYEFYKSQNGSWVKIEIIREIPVWDVYACDVGNFDPRFDGNEVIVFTAENITEFAWNGTEWYNETIVIPGYYIRSGRVSEINTTNNVSEIVCGNKYGYVMLVWWNGTEYEMEEIRIFEDMDTIYSVAVGDCWRGHAGNEIVVGGGSAARTMLVWDENGTWKKQLIYENGSHYDVTDIEIGDFDLTHPGNEIIIAPSLLFELYENTPVNESTSPIFVIVPMIGIIPAVIWRLRQEWR